MSLFACCLLLWRHKEKPADFEKRQELSLVLHQYMQDSQLSTGFGK
jgi:hypothetical protein